MTKEAKQLYVNADPRLIDSQYYCRQIVERSGSSFRKSFSFLRADARDAMHTLYAFARLTDDLADNGDVDRAAAIDACRHLHRWLAQLAITDLEDDSRIVTHTADLSVSLKPFVRLMPALSVLVNRDQVDPERLRDLVRGAEFDLQEPVYVKTDEELGMYCRWVASSVGLACVQIWKGNLAACEEAAIQCGIAFQLTNILRDVSEDGKLGRLYLPDAELLKYGCDRQSFLNGKPLGDWRALMRSYVQRAKALYQQGWQVYDHLPMDGQRMFSLMWTSYRALLDAIDANLDQVWTKRIRLSYAKKSALYLQHAISPLFFQRSVDRRQS